VKLNDVTFLVSIFFLPIWLVWELVALWLRSKGVAGGGLEGTTSTSVGTISMVMQHRGYQMNALPFFWSAMAAHWWFNWFGTKTWVAPYPAITFWLMVVGTLCMDAALWHTPYETLSNFAKFYRAPMVQAALGFFAAYFLFPQEMPKGPGWRWW
jgi:hypothetical protein